MGKERSFLLRGLTIIVLLLVINTANGIETSTDEVFATASEHYINEEYNEALVLWLDLFEAGYDNHELLYNIGNAWFKLNNLPMSILFYERALLRKPGDEDTRFNIEIARAGLRDRFEEIPALFITRWIDYITLSASSDSWALFSLISFLLCLSFLLIFLFSSKHSVKGATFSLALVLILFSAASIVFSIRNSNLVYNSRYAVVTGQIVTGRSTPSESGRELFVIHEGLKVRAEEKIGEWIEIRLPDGNKGWVKEESIISL